MMWFLSLLKRGFAFKVTRSWPGEEKLKRPDPYKKRKDAIEEIIEDMDRKKRGGYGNI